MSDELAVDSEGYEADLAKGLLESITEPMGRVDLSTVTPEQLLTMCQKAYEIGYGNGCIFGMRGGVLCASLWLARRGQAVAAMDMLIALTASDPKVPANA